jgi:ribonuclease P protein component
MESNYAAENLPTEQPPPREEARIQGEDGDEERPGGAEAPQGEGPQAPHRSALLGFSLPKEARLRKRAEFLRVYEQGKRFEGRFMTVFILPNSGPLHRFGVTATKKGIGTRAHDRNRAKRLLREAFRLNRNETDAVGVKLDWVLNARRSILRTKLAGPFEDLRAIAAKVKAAEAELLPQSTRSLTD